MLDEFLFGQNDLGRESALLVNIDDAGAEFGSTGVKGVAVDEGGVGFSRIAELAFGQRCGR